MLIYISDTINPTKQTFIKQKPVVIQSLKKIKMKKKKLLKKNKLFIRDLRKLKQENA